MDYIRVSIKMLFVFALVILVSQIQTHTSIAKANDDLRNAFRNSYNEEQSENYREAITSLMNEYDESSYELNLRIGWLNYKNGTYDESVEFYRKAIELQPFALEPRLGLAYPLAEAEKWDELEANYKSILAIDPNNTIASYNLGYKYYLNLEYTIAKSYFEKVVNLYPFDHYSNLMLGWTHFQMANYREAEEQFRKVLLINPDDESALEGLLLMGK